MGLWSPSAGLRRGLSLEKQLRAFDLQIVVVVAVVEWPTEQVEEQIVVEPFAACFVVASSMMVLVASFESTLGHCG